MGDLMWVPGENGKYVLVDDLTVVDAVDNGKYVLVDDLTVVDAVDNIMGAHKRAFDALGEPDAESCEE